MAWQVTDALRPPPLPAGPLPVLTPWPAARPALALLELLLGPTNTAFSGHILLGILYPADELVAGQRRDVPPGMECRGIGDQRLAQVWGKLVHHPAGYLLAAHTANDSGPGASRFGHLSWPDRTPVVHK